jgi:hypothetical protein
MKHITPAAVQGGVRGFAFFGGFPPVCTLVARSVLRVVRQAPGRSVFGHDEQDLPLTERFLILRPQKYV